MLREYIEELKKAGLVEVEDKNRGEIRTTKKGVEYLNNFEDLMSLMRNNN